MRRLLIHHEVVGEVRAVFAGFTQALFEALAPRFPPATLLRYDGNAVGDEVHLRLGKRPFAQQWVSVITANACDETTCYFVDEGRRLPFPLRFWRHRHHLEQVAPRRVVITEDITFATGYRVVDALMAPVLRAQFEARGPKYRSFFARQHELADRD